VKKEKIYRMMWIILSVVILLATAVIIFIDQPKFGRTPRAERMERIKASPNYRDGKFQNLHVTQQITSDRGFFGSLMDFVFRNSKSLRPHESLPVVKTDLRKLNKKEDLLVWFGHSTYLMQVDGKRMLVDPVFYEASPVSFINKPFKGVDVYSPEDIPDIDFLIISHDHWDHLDHKTVTALKDRIKTVICPLGVGEHFEYWGFAKDRIVELDWNENATLEDGFTVYCLPARHFSGRGLSPNQTLWASFLMQTPSQRIYVAGDGGYDTHFAEIGEQFPGIDLAVLENGQYDQDWKYIHLLPEQLAQTAKDLKAKKVFTVHNSKYALAKHAWQQPLNTVEEVIEKDSLNFITPMMGEVVSLRDSSQVFQRWWENLE